MIKANQLKARLDKITENKGDVAEFLVDGLLMTIPKSELLQALRDEMEDRDTPYTRIIRNASASKGFGKLLQLNKMLRDPLPTVAKEPNFEEHLANLHGIPASETGN
jgi:hypothetical protein